MSDSQTISTVSSNLDHKNSRTVSSWSPPTSFSITSEDESIFLVDKITVARHKRTPQSFSLAPVSEEESLALSAWEENDNIEDNSVDKNSNLGFSSDTNTVNTYNDDTASVTTCSTITTTNSSYPSEVNISLADLMNYNNNKPVNKQKIVNFKDEIVESESVDLTPSSVISGDSSTIRDSSYSLYQEKFSVISSGLQASLELEVAKHDKQRILRGWVKCLWPQLRLPSVKYLANKLDAHSLSKRNLNPLVVGIITIQNSEPMISTIIVNGTRHSNDGIERNGKIKFVGKPTITKGIYDPREYLLLHCPTYNNPPYYNHDPRVPWTEKFLLDKVLPRLANEATRIQSEVGLYLTVKETLLRGLEQYSLYECRKCTLNYVRTFTYSGIHKHLLSNRHGVKIVSDEDMIRINLREYISAFYKNLPPNIIFEQ